MSLRGRERGIEKYMCCVCCIPCFIFDDSVVHFSRESIIIGNHLGVKRFVVQDTVVCVSQREAKSLFTVIIECTYPPNTSLKMSFSTNWYMYQTLYACLSVCWMIGSLYNGSVSWSDILSYKDRVFSLLMLIL